jgi:hypothetical protein
MSMWTHFANIFELQIHKFGQNKENFGLEIYT